MIGFGYMPRDTGDTIGEVNSRTSAAVWGMIAIVGVAIAWDMSRGYGWKK